MDYSLELKDEKKKESILFLVIIFSMAILLHQSQIILGINISFADFFCMILIMILVSKNQILIPVSALKFFILVSIVVLISATYYIPIKFRINPNFIAIINDYIKLFAIFAYFLIGYNLAKINLLDKTIKWYSLFGFVIGILGIFLTLFNIKTLSEIFYFADIRYRGLMLDPNYFSVLQITALVYFTRVKSVRLEYKYLAIFIMLFSVLNSGSKTGIITLICYLVFRLVEYTFFENKKVVTVVSFLLVFILLVLSAPMVVNFYQSFVSPIVSSIPSFSRIEPLLTDFSNAISANGSGRDITWKVAFHIIQISPLIGLGIGTYTNFGYEMFQEKTLAHNTFLQLTAEWGIPMAFFLFFYVFFLLGKVSMSRLHHSEINLVLRDIIIILLIGSLSISLNNARILWIILGALIFSINRKSKSFFIN